MHALLVLALLIFAFPFLVRVLSSIFHVVVWLIVVLMVFGFVAHFVAE
jgi:hypothetical protein